MRSLDIPDFRGLTLLVVDDNDDSLEMLATFLEGCGASVLPARNGMAAAAYIETAPKIDALITDLAMPAMDGAELVRRLRGHPIRHALPAIAVSGFFHDYMDVRGFDAFLRKPVDLDELCRQIRTAVDARAA
jgi:CheY-like chemotaxis protein